MLPDRSPDDPGPADAEARRRPAASRPRVLRLTLQLTAAAGLVAGLGLLARTQSRPDAPPAADLSAAAPAAAPVRPDPVPLAASPARLLLAEPGADPVRTEPGRLDPASGLREDALSRGAFEALETPALRLVLTRGPGAERAPGLFVLLARRAAVGPALAVTRTGAAGRIDTRFGPVETLEATLSGPLARVCIGFVTRGAAFRLDGWLCAPLGRAPEPRALACTLDALTLDDPADPAAVAAFRAGRPDGAGGCDRPSAAADPAGRTGSIDRSRRGRARQAKN
ncbi:hypothetical protein Q8W71_10695 [Methylobacterium sp. NEAU 140]|uniref:hypothetical protein n=1 Tax=Methylobacterium sp. NEAU 140 TaxID=3064945 RepID=UPI002734998B|nr:hypothetical protein [Methylobacterium sp. NEAU 140]MDP4023092.1 hypothetical protein [Methylobacterium sp. NEAU 140]